MRNPSPVGIRTLALLSALSVSLALPSFSQAPAHDPVYGGDEPNPIQVLNRYLSLLEHSLLSVVMTSYSGDVRDKAFMINAMKDYPDWTYTEKTGYFFDRESHEKDAWTAYGVAQDAIGAGRSAVLQGETFAGTIRTASFRKVARAYLQETVQGKWAPEKLTDFESSFLVSYLHFAKESDHKAFLREWIHTVVPSTPDDIYLLKVRVSVARALIRSELTTYLSNTPSGTVDINGEYTHVSEITKLLLAKDKEALSDMYQLAAMTYPDRARPTVAANGDSDRSPNPDGTTNVVVTAEDKPLVEHFSDLEHAVLTYLLSSTESRREFRADTDTSDRNPSATAGFAAKWKRRVAAETDRYLDQESSAERMSDNPAIKGVGVFEAGILRERLNRIDIEMWPRLYKLGLAAVQAAEEGDTEAPVRVATKLRSLLRQDFTTYKNSKGEDDGTALSSWAATALAVDDPTFHDIFPSPDAPVEGASLTAALSQLFPDKVERAFAEYLIKASDSKEADTAALIAAAAKPADDAERAALVLDWRKKAGGAVTQQLALPSAAVTTHLSSQGVSTENLKEYYCPRLASPSLSSGGEDSAMGQLQTLARRSSDAGRAATNEEASSLAGVVPPQALIGICTQWFNDKKLTAALNGVGGAPEDNYNLPIGDVPPLGNEGSEAKADDKGGVLGSVLDKVNAQTGAIVGVVLGAALVAMMGLGPLGFIAVLFGAMIIGAVVQKVRAPKKKN